MANVTVKRIEEMDYYQGPGAIPGIRFRGARAALGVTAWGMGIIEMEPGVTAYPEHDHLRDGQEEVYALLRGTATLQLGEEAVALEPGVFVRVGPAQRRKILPGPQGCTVLALGSTPGKAYQPRG
jgi:mannose-6-phosphate isomerase-like protein (cupin superfamily)